MRVLRITCWNGTGILFRPGKWMWWSWGIGGRSALDYLIKVRDYTFMEAVETLAGLAGVKPPVPLPAEKQTKKLLLPEPCRYQTRVVSYLRGRGIDREIVDFCLQTGRVYESGRYHNAVFVGRDRAGKPRYAAICGIMTDFIGDASGSDKNFSFSIPARLECGEGHKDSLRQIIADFKNYMVRTEKILSGKER